MRINTAAKHLQHICLTSAAVILMAACSADNKKETTSQTYYFPEGYLDEADQIPSFWIASIDEINNYLKTKVKKGKVETVGTSAGGRPIFSVSYGSKRTGKGTTTFSGSLGVYDIAPYRGKDNDKLVYMALGGVHGFELEGMMGVINMIEVFETGKDLSGKERPELASMLDSIDRIVLIPLVNPDGRARIPIRMETDKGVDSPQSFTVHEYLNTGGKKDGSIIGWPEVKEFIPMNFADFGFPGGYPNDNGVNIMHDDFFGKIQPETKMLFDITADEKPDLIMNMHTGVPKDNYFMQIHRPFSEPELQPIFEILYRKIKTSLTLNKLQGTTDVAVESAPPTGMSRYNLSTALNLHCGALSVVIESPSHGFQGTNLAGAPTAHTPEMLLNAQIIAHLESMRFLAETGGRSKWQKDFFK
ncbi:M14 family zinc carboxypeptidase [Pseudopedobacter beijingensis]|uniref:M14 family zinc carboxypeptidase n=1 Tax=Pseudopedobacter beijingensis TaxID=1207056 RepID=A0ABW4IC55_9SPHI